MTTGVARLQAAFRPGRAALVAYLPIGDPDAFDARTLDAYRDAGVAVLEVGIPTADPWLDGPEVTDSMQRALAAGTDAWTIADRLATWRAAQTGPCPAILWFSYPTLPLDALEHTASVGAVDGLLMLAPWRHPDAASLPGRLERAGIARCTFLPWEPTDDDHAAVRATTGSVMVQARPGVTGTDAAPADPTDQIRLARAMSPGNPVVAGFGVHDAASVRAVVGAGADGVVVGSACIRAAREGSADGVAALLRQLVAATETPA